MSMFEQGNQAWDIAVLGGGPAGLAAAALAAKSGKSVVLLEKAPSFGGRSSSVREGGAVWNLGAHALYRGGAAERVLRSLGIWPQGGSPSPNIQWVPEQGRGDMVSTAGLLIGRTLHWSEKRRFLRFFLGLRKADPSSAAGMPWTEWIARAGLTGRAADLANALARLSIYTGDGERLDASAAIRQLQRPSVAYPDGGWQTFVDGLAAKASEVGAQCRTSASVAGVQRLEEGGGWRVRLAGGETLQARRIIAAVEPSRFLAWFEPWLPSGYFTALKKLQPVFVSALDLHLRRLPRPKNAFALGFDRPLYFSAHSRWARLCDRADHAVVHVMRYGGERDGESGFGREELETFLDRVQPGWRDEVVRARYLPHITVMHGLPSVELKGTKGRPPVDTGLEGVYAAGDWAGAEGLLLDASLHSAGEAAALAVRSC